MTDNLDRMIEQVRDGSSLSATQAEAAFDRFMDGSAGRRQMAALLEGLNHKGFAPSEIAGGVRALRRAMIAVDAGDPAQVTDTSGTGGGTLTTFNISTAAAFVAAGGGARIAKHGNRSFTSRSGSADVLEAMGIAIEVPPDALARLARDIGIVFLYAPAHHPAMRHVGPVRREMGVTTIMNILGPLANPAGARRQVVGVADPRLLPLVAAALKELGHLRAVVAHGDPGLDELSPIGTTRIAVLDGDRVEEREITPEAFGIAPGESADLAGGSPQENARRILDVLSGDDQGLARAAIVLNAAAALFVAGVAKSLHEGLLQAERSVDSGAALERVEALRGAAPIA